MITPKMRRRMDILLVDDGSPRFLDAVRLLQDLLISRVALPKSSVRLYGIVEPNQSFDLLIRETILEQARARLADKGLKVETRPLPIHVKVQVLDYMYLMPATNLGSRRQLFGPDAFHRVLPDTQKKINTPIRKSLEERAVHILSEELIKAARLSILEGPQRMIEKLKTSQFDLVVLDLDGFTQLVEQKESAGNLSFPVARCGLLIVHENSEPCSSSSFDDLEQIEKDDTRTSTA